MRVVLLLILLGALCLPASTLGARAASPPLIDYPMFNFNAMRTGINPAERILTPSTVGRLKRLWSVQLDGVADESVIELTGVGPAKNLNLLYTTTRRGVTYALNAVTGAKVWTFDPHDQSLPDARITTATPAADSSKAWVYSASPDGHIHKLSAVTGAEAHGWPVSVTLHPQDEKIASALNLVGNTLLVTTSGYIGDAGNYDGHIVAINTRNRRMGVFNSLCATISRLIPEPEGSPSCGHVQSGIWARAGTVVDTMSGSPTQGDIFTATGNGAYDGVNNWGDSVLRLTLAGTAMALKDAYTPNAFAMLDSQDLDLGSTTPILAPRQPGPHPWLAVQGGKDNYLRVLNRADLSGRGGLGHTSGELSALAIPQGGQMPTAGIAWADSSGKTWIFYTTDKGIGALRLTISNGRPTLQLAWVHYDTYSSPLLAGGVLYAAESGALRAFNPVTGVQLWSSSLASAGGDIQGVHWESPTVVNGRVYMPDESGAITAYGL
ncbi:MAG TPA: PQQ-binding-like beta-propeller repeat protein [Chloroflexota bacterium]|nr:PQQ-binding-like beta-propeller repeat protein [Chloroflexota bacterium]